MMPLMRTTAHYPRPLSGNAQMFVREFGHVPTVIAPHQSPSAQMLQDSAHMLGLDMAAAQQVVTRMPMPVQYGGGQVPDAQISYTGDIDADVAAGAPGAATRDAVARGSKLLMWLAVAGVAAVALMAFRRARS